MADHHDAQDYTANGPTDIGFRTGGTRIKNGVVAFGTETGVHGIGRVPEGETGQTVGVLGEGLLGVQGLGQTVDGATGESQGVVGHGSIGVHGVGQDAGSRGVFGDGDIGVKGVGDLVGVQGESESDSGRGGVFLSRHSAQINLVPTLNNLPAKGQADDLIAIMAEQGRPDTAELWFCVASGDPVADPGARWGRVQFDKFHP